MPPMTKFIQASSGIFPRVIPGQRMDRIVAMKFTAAPILPMPETSSASVQ